MLRSNSPVENWRFWAVKSVETLLPTVEVAPKLPSPSPPTRTAGPSYRNVRFGMVASSFGFSPSGTGRVAVVIVQSPVSAVGLANCVPSTNPPKS
jgi:hypothetical protein